MEDQELVPEELAEIIFSNLPQATNSISLLPQVNEEMNLNSGNNEYITYIFEILITIFMEGLMDSKRLLEMVINDKFIDKTENEYLNYYDINIDVLVFLEQWFKSFGYFVNIREYESNDEIDNQNRYCEIILKSNPHQKGLFIYKKILDKEYHFTLNSNFNISAEDRISSSVGTRQYEKKSLKLENLLAKLEIPEYKENPLKIYTISFKAINFNNCCK